MSQKVGISALKNTPDPTNPNSGFDEFAPNYDSALSEGLSVSGEGKEYFARRRIEWLDRQLKQIGEKPLNVMDYGCGTGSSTPYFFEILNVRSVIGVDSSFESIKIAQQTYGCANSQFLQPKDYSPSEELDLLFCNGVFHHIPPNERDKAVNFLHRSVRRGGLLGFWENNPWNPGTRLVMKRIPFDRDAITLTALESRQMLRRCGFEILRTDFLFIFPRVLRGLRGIEPFVSRLPVGAQYQILCRKA